MATYFVKTGGNDAADGLSDANAWATIAKVNAFAFAPGDIVQFRQGDTFTGQFYSASHNGVTFRSYNPATGLPSAVGTRALVQNTTPDTVFGAPTGVNNIVLDNIEVATNQPTSGAAQASIIANDAAAVCTGWTIRNCHIHQCGGSGIRISAATSIGWTITGNTIQDVGDNGVLCNSDGGGHTITDNTFDNCGGFDALQGRHGIYAKSPNNVISGNDFRNCPNGQAISVRFGDTVVKNNKIHDTPFGIGLFNQDTRIAGSQGPIRIYGNKFYNITAGNGYAIYGDNVVAWNGDLTIASNTIVCGAAVPVCVDIGAVTTCNVVFKNNIVQGGVNAIYAVNVAMTGGKTFASNNNVFSAQTGGTPFKYLNVLQTFANWKTNSGQDSVSLTSDPGLSPSPALAPSSTAVRNAGTTIVLNLAYVTGSPQGNQIQYLESAPDIGAVETTSTNALLTWIRRKFRRKVR